MVKDAPPWRDKSEKKQQQWGKAAPGDCQPPASSQPDPRHAARCPGQSASQARMALPTASVRQWRSAILFELRGGRTNHETHKDIDSSFSLFLGFCLTLRFWLISCFCFPALLNEVSSSTRPPTGKQLPMHSRQRTSTCQQPEHGSL